MSKATGAASSFWDLSVDVPAAVVDPNTIGIASNLDPIHVIQLAVDCGMEHIVQRDGLAFECEVQTAQTMVSHPEAFFTHPLNVIFGSPSGADHFVDFGVTCGSDEKKKNVLFQFEAFLKGLTGARSIREEAMMIADELYTNGAKNGAPLVGHTDPSLIIPGSVQFVARSDKSRLVLGCIDTYGALDITIMLKRIQTCLTNGVAQSINQNQRFGAGIGSFMVFSSAISMYIAVDRGRKSVVLCSLPLSKRLKETINIPKNLHTLTRG